MNLRTTCAALALIAASLGLAQAQTDIDPRLLAAQQAAAQSGDAQSTSEPSQALPSVNFRTPSTGVSSITPLPRPQSSATLQMAPPVPDAQILETQIGAAPVFGQSLFRGRFAQQSFRGFNPDYVISVGDTINVQMWGSVEQQMQVVVDAQGNVFLPKIGPVKVAGVRNGELNAVVQQRMRSVFREDVGVYATLAQSVPVQVYVAGHAVAPGLYAGFASDSILTFLDRAGGVNPTSGSYLNVRVLRGDTEVETVNLYDFIVRGTLPAMQLHDGDTIFVGAIGNIVQVSGLVTTPAQYEFNDGQTINDLLGIAGISGRATNVRVIRNNGRIRDVHYVKRDDAFLNTPLQTGDEVEVTADRRVGAIAVSVEGEHEGAGQFVLPYDATLQDLLDQVKLSPQSAPRAIQLFRLSVASRQKQVLDDMLQRLEQSVLAARSATTQEAQLRTQEADLVLKFVERAKDIQPRGQVILTKDVNPAAIALEDGDVIRIPRVSNLVAVHGEVYLPNSFVWQHGSGVRDYIQQAGGMLQSSSADRTLLIRQSGEVITGVGRSFLSSDDVLPGDEIMVLPAVDPKRFQFAKDIVQIMYQTAVAAGVLVRL